MQEHWISSFDLHKLQDLSHDMICYANSAMDATLSRGLMKGRPFGGVAVYIKDMLAAVTTLVKKDERFIILRVNDLILINVYLPCASNTDWQDQYMNCLAAISNELSSLN